MRNKFFDYFSTMLQALVYALSQIWGFVRFLLSSVGAWVVGLFFLLKEMLVLTGEMVGKALRFMSGSFDAGSELIDNSAIISSMPYGGDQLAFINDYIFPIELLLQCCCVVATFYILGVGVRVVYRLLQLARG